jgi:hypothetical protein
MPGAVKTPFLIGAGSEIERRETATLFPSQLGLVRRMLSREYEKAMDPMRVAGVVMRALTAKKPRPYYTVGNDPLRVMLGMLPARLTDWLIMRQAV